MKSFAEIQGQEAAIGELRAEAARGRLSHAYLFEGRDGTGRLSLARVFAAFVLCECAGGDNPCGICRSCRMLEAGTHPDYLELPRGGSALKISHFVRREGAAEEGVPALEFLYRKPLAGTRSVCVVPDAERMGDEAANSFLKTLEEPPGEALILLTASARDRLLATIVSRCRRVQVRPLAVAAVAAELERRGLLAGEAAREAAALGEGSLGLALQLAGSDATENWRWIGESLQRFTPAGAVDFARGLIERSQAGGGDGLAKRRAAAGLLDLVALRVRRALREGLPPLAAERALTALWRAGEQLELNVRLELALHAAALEIFAALRRG